jgi:hypothetical protein
MDIFDIAREADELRIPFSIRDLEHTLWLGDDHVVDVFSNRIRLRSYNQYGYLKEVANFNSTNDLFQFIMEN